MFVPLIIMNAILAVVTILLAVADRLLVTYGDCTVTIKSDRESKQFVVAGGGNLLTALVDNGEEISSSCGGKGTCGYCKCRVTSGGGQLLPTEEIFMSRKEREQDMRLACQVKIKEDIDIEIPDFLTVVRQMVESGKFEARKRWKVTIK